MLGAVSGSAAAVHPSHSAGRGERAAARLGRSAAVAVGHGLRVFAAGVTAALFVGLGAVLGLAVSLAGAAAIVVVALVAGVGLAPLLAVRLGKVPFPVVSAAARASSRPNAARTAPPYGRAWCGPTRSWPARCSGISLTAVGCVAVLAGGGGLAGPLLAGLASAALLLRARLFPSVAARLPLLAGGLVGLALTAAAGLAAAGRRRGWSA